VRAFVYGSLDQMFLLLQNTDNKKEKVFYFENENTFRRSPRYWPILLLKVKTCEFPKKFGSFGKKPRPTGQGELHMFLTVDNSSLLCCVLFYK